MYSRAINKARERKNRHTHRIARTAPQSIHKWAKMKTNEGRKRLVVCSLSLLLGLLTSQCAASGSLGQPENLPRNNNNNHHERYYSALSSAKALTASDLGYGRVRDLGSRGGARKRRMLARKRLLLHGKHTLQFRDEGNSIDFKDDPGNYVLSFF